MDSLDLQDTQHQAAAMKLFAQGEQGAAETQIFPGHISLGRRHKRNDCTGNTQTLETPFLCSVWAAAPSSYL